MCLLLLCGLPAAGKTTLARALAQHTEQQGASCGVRVLHVCFDDFQQAGGRFHPVGWKVPVHCRTVNIAIALSNVQLCRARCHSNALIVYPRVDLHGRTGWPATRMGGSGSSFVRSRCRGSSIPRGSRRRRCVHSVQQRSARPAAGCQQFTAAGDRRRQHAPAQHAPPGRISSFRNHPMSRSERTSPRWQCALRCLSVSIIGLQIVPPDGMLNEWPLSCLQARRLAAQHGAAFQILYLYVMPEDAMRRNAARPPPDCLPQDVMWRMCQVRQHPEMLDLGVAPHQMWCSDCPAQPLPSRTALKVSKER